MTRLTIIRRSLLLVSFAAAAFSAGCSSLGGPAPEEVQTYALTAERSGTPRQRTVGEVLQVLPFSAAPLFDTQLFVYRRSVTEGEMDYTNRFMMPPADLVAGVTRTWLADSGLFANVAGPVAPTPARYRLHGHVNAIYGDTGGRGSVAVVDVQFVVIDAEASGEGVIFNQAYRHRESVRDGSTQGLVEAWNTGLEAILDKLEQDLAGKLFDNVKARTDSANVRHALAARVGKMTDG